MQELDHTIANDRVRLALQATGDGHVLLAQPARSSLPAWSCQLGGTVVAGSIGVRGPSITCLIRPFGDVGTALHGVLELRMTWTLDRNDVDRPSDSFGVTLKLEASSDYPLEEVSAPGPVRLTPTGAADWRFLVPLAEGCLLPAAGELPERVSFFDNAISLPLLALVPGEGSDRGSLLVITPQGDDHAVRPLSAAAGRSPGVELIQLAALGRWAYDRIWRFVWVSSPDLISLANTVRSELRATGLRLDSLADKVQTLPEPLRDGTGGTHLWHLDPIPSDLVTNLQRDGMRSVALLGRVAPGSDVARDAAAAGYVVAPYFQTSDILPPGFGRELEWRGTYPPEGAVHGWPDQLMRTSAGWFDPNWMHTPAPDASPYWGNDDFIDSQGRLARRPQALRDFSMVQGYRRCAHFHDEALRTFGIPLWDRDGYTGVFYDVMTAMHATECFALGHPCDRRTDTALRREALATTIGTGRFAGSEFGKWWALDVLHAFEGILSYGESNINTRLLADYPFSTDWYDTEFNLQQHVPFFGMVARHSAVRTRWWGHGQDRHAESWGAKDALCAAFGGNPIFVVDGDHPLLPGTARWKRFRHTAQTFDLLRRRTFGSAIQDYRVLGRHVSVTGFADGTTVRANVGPLSAEGLDAGSFEIRDERGQLIGGSS